MFNFLIVDDSATIRAMVKKALTLSVPNIGEIYEAADGFAALAMASEHDVDLMLLDINMPKLNGLQLIRKIKSDASLANIPIVVVSTEGSEERLDEIRSAGVAGYIRKPFRPEQLRTVLSQILEIGDDCHAEQSGQYDF